MITTKNNQSRLRDQANVIRKLSKRARVNGYRIFKIKRFKKKIDYAIYCDFDLDIPKISNVETNIIRSNQPFRRYVTKSIYLKALHPYTISKISDVGKQNYD